MTEPFLPMLLFGVALLYGSVGHGGASGYLAVLALTSATMAESAALALAANVLVAGVSFVAFWRAGHFRPGLTWPFLLGSAPLAVVGGATKLPPGPHFALAGCVIALAGVRTLLPLRPREAPAVAPTSVKVGLGAGIGFLSGMVGVGGGIFLSPILVLARWANAKDAAASSALFIVVNSICGLVPRASTLASLPGSSFGLIGACVVGSLVGSGIGAKRASPEALKRVLGVVLVLASVKLFQRALG